MGVRSDGVSAWQGDRLALQLGIQHHVDGNPDRIVRDIAGTGYRGLSFQSATDVVFAVDDHVPPVDFDSLKKWRCGFDVASDGVVRCRATSPSTHDVQTVTNLK